MKNIIVVTGGAGFVGTNLIELLLKKTKINIITHDKSSSG
jgi:UDP-glucose 4-epimerase